MKTSAKSRGAKKAKVKLDEYGQRKLAAQRQLPVGKRVTYRGHGVDKLAGKPGVVVKHESRGGVFVKVGDKTFLVSPFALVEKPAAKKAAKPAKKAAKRPAPKPEAKPAAKLKLAA